MDNLTKEQRKKNMTNIRSKNTLPERILRKEIRKLGIKFNCHNKSVYGIPDFVFPKYNIALFVDSDFWHVHPKRFIAPKSNTDYWTKKLSNNVRRDKLVNKTLKKEGWNVIRIWEYDIKYNLSKVILKIQKRLI